MEIKYLKFLKNIATIEDFDSDVTETSIEVFERKYNIEFPIVVKEFCIICNSWWGHCSEYFITDYYDLMGEASRLIIHQLNYRLTNNIKINNGTLELLYNIYVLGIGECGNIYFFRLDDDKIDPKIYVYDSWEMGMGKYSNVSPIYVFYDSFITYVKEHVGYFSMYYDYDKEKNQIFLRRKDLYPNYPEIIYDN